MKEKRKTKYCREKNWKNYACKKPPVKKSIPGAVPGRGWKLPFPNFTNQGSANFGASAARRRVTSIVEGAEIGRISCLVVLKYVLAL